MESMMKTLGSWLFFIGIVVAILVGLVFGIGYSFDANNASLTDMAAPLGAIVAVLGFLVGILSFFALGTITHERIPTFLIGALALVVIGVTSSFWATTWVFGTWTGLATLFSNITTYLAFFVAPAAGLLAIRAVWDAGKSETIERIIPKMK
jgi:hypothetical protein